MLGLAENRVDGMRQRRIGRCRKNVRLTCRHDDVRCVPAAGAFRMEHVDPASGDRIQSVLYVTGFVEAVGVQRYLEAELVGCVGSPNGDCVVAKACRLRGVLGEALLAFLAVLDRYTLADVVEVTLRKLRRDDVPLPFSAEADAAASPARLPARQARKLARRTGSARLDETEGVLHQLLGEYSI